MRLVIALGATAILVLAMMPSIAGRSPLLVWNGSASAPLGLYRRTADGPLAIGDWVLARPPARTMALAGARDYVAAGVPLIKQVAGLSGDLVCRSNDVVTRNGHTVALALARDSMGRALPRWQGCQTLSVSQIFLLNRPRQSFDSRYFGPVDHAQILERIKPLWTF